MEKVSEDKGGANVQPDGVSDHTGASIDEPGADVAGVVASIDEALPGASIEKTCLTCRMLGYNTPDDMKLKKGQKWCPKVKIIVDLKTPLDDCEYWRQPSA